uniref:Lysine-specific demethylase 5D isoform X1 n=1 Tax=Tanacetum cinerariifolium TaxID=118510 RepID=A0A699GHK2_TANCI|nr:lysine-specific demethylase 5D isoform X1 [Tanacetum cinerariifolium]
MSTHGRKKAIAEPTPPDHDPRDDIVDEDEEYPFVNKYPSLKEEPIMLVEDESCLVYDTNNEAKESMSIYDTDIEDVIEEEEGFFNNPHQVSYNIPKALHADVGCITIVSIVSTPVNSGNLSLPVVYPFLKREPKPFSGLTVPEANPPCSTVGEGKLSASEEDQGHHDTLDYDNRTQDVTFREPESSTTVQDESHYSHDLMCQERPQANPNIKKGYVIIVLREIGRKCITCVGYPINELKRGHLGRCSNVFKNLLTDNQVKQVMTFEKSYRVNQAPYWLIIVNGEPLSFDKVLILQTYAYPPKRLVQEDIGMIRCLDCGERMGINHPSDAFDWLLRFNEIVKNTQDQDDQENIVNELVFLEKDRPLLKDQVDELLLVDVELKKASCGVEAWKVFGSKMPLESVHQVIVMATELQIENEKVFKKITDVLAQAVCLEEKSKHMLSCEVQMSEFEDVVRMSEDLSAVIPTLDAVKGALSVGKSWLTKSKPFLASDLSLMLVLNSLLKVNTLKILVWKSKSLKILVEERSLLEDVLASFMKWETNAYSALDDAYTLPMVVEYFLSRVVEISSMTYEPSDEDILYADAITFSNGLASMQYSIPSTLPVTFMDATEQNHASLQRCQLIRVKMTKIQGRVFFQVEEDDAGGIK